MNDRQEMIKLLASLEANKQAIQGARKDLARECSERQDAVSPALETIGEHPDMEDAGILGHRYHKTILADHHALGELARRG
ncbi:MAG: hypothetical protein WC911_01905 [Thermoleophilia bacterium]